MTTATIRAFYHNPQQLVGEKFLIAIQPIDSFLTIRRPERTVSPTACTSRGSVIAIRQPRYRSIFKYKALG